MGWGAASDNILWRESVGMLAVLRPWWKDDIKCRVKARSWVVPTGSLLCACYPPTEDCRPPSTPPSEIEIPLRSHLGMSHSISSQKQSRFSILVLNLLWTYFLSPIFFDHIPSDILLLFQDSLNFPGRTKEELFCFPLLGFYIYPEDTVWVHLISHSMYIQWGSFKL